MSSLFSSFEPASINNLPLNWMSSLLVLMVLPVRYWKALNQSAMMFKNMIFYVKNEFQSSLSPLSNPGTLIISLSLFVVVLSNNTLGLTPYTFTASSHLSFTLSAAISLWLGHMVVGIVKSPQNMLAHVVPLGTPGPLIPFMVVVEIISSSIRPVTLSIRLAANMTAGHLLLALLGGSGSVSNLYLTSMVVIGLVLLSSLELAVSVIQSYVFSVLSTLYINEVNSPLIH